MDIGSDMVTESSPKPASGTRACGPCAASKAKCIFNPATISATNGKCSRCNRLNKACVVQNAVTRMKRPRTNRRVTQLDEGSDEGLVSRLDASLQTLPIRDSNGKAPSRDLFESQQFIRPGVSPSEYHTTVSSYSHSSNSPLPNQVASAPNVTGSSEPPVRSINLRDPEAVLSFFRSEMASQFPFVVIPPETKAYALGLDKPFLLKTIIMAASVQDAKAQAAMAGEIMEYLSLYMLIRSEKSLDLLQGLLVYMAWLHSHLHLGRRLNTLLQLAEALVIDLQLHKEPLVGLARDEKAREFWIYSEGKLGSERRTLEERRTFLGLVYLSSVSSLYLSYMEPIRYRKYAQNCIDIIDRSHEYPSDQFLLELMKLESIAGEISDALPRDTQELSPISGPVALCIKTLQRKLNLFHERVPNHLGGDPCLLMYYHSILVYLTETALYTPSLPSRTATLHACLTSTISFFSALFSIPTLEYFKITYPFWIQMTYCLNVLSKLSLFESDDWDLSHVAGMVDLSLVLAGILGKFEELRILRRQLASSHAPSEFGADSGDGLLKHFIPKFQHHKEAFERRREEIMRRADPMAFTAQPILISEANQPRAPTMTAPVLSETVFHSQMPLNQFEMPGVDFSPLDNQFWQEFIGQYPSM